MADGGWARPGQTVTVRLDEPPRVVSPRVGVHRTTSQADGFRLPDLWQLHLYRYAADLHVAGEPHAIRPGYVCLSPPRCGGPLPLPRAVRAPPRTSAAAGRRRSGRPPRRAGRRCSHPGALRAPAPGHRVGSAQSPPGTRAGCEGVGRYEALRSRAALGPGRPRRGRGWRRPTGPGTQGRCRYAWRPRRPCGRPCTEPGRRCWWVPPRGPVTGPGRGTAPRPRPQRWDPRARARVRTA